MNSRLWTLGDMLPKIVVTNANLDVHGMAQYFEETHREESIDVVKFMRKFVRGTQVGDLRNLGNSWIELTALDVERTAAHSRKDAKECGRITDKLRKVGIALKDSKNPKTGEITTTWEVTARLR